MTTTKLFLGGVAVALIVVFALFLTGTVQSPNGALGGVSSPDFNIGAVRLVSAGTDSLTQATSTALCALQSPSSTSTLVMASVRLDTATSGATQVSASKSVDPGVIGTTAVIASTTLATTAKLSMILASSTVNQESLDDRIFPPNYYLVVAQTAGGILNQTGSCKAVWQVQ